MQNDFDWHYPSLEIQILGINQLGQELGNEGITQAKDLPWLQDVDSDGDSQSDVWLNSWDFEYRDVVLVDRDSTVIEAFNVTSHDLSDAENYSTLKHKFIDAAATPPLSPWQQSIEPLDVDGNGLITPLDALLVINDLGDYTNGLLPDLGGQTPAAHIDVDGDGYCAPLDALLVINQLNVISSGIAAAAPAAPLSAAVSVSSDIFTPEHSASSEVADGAAAAATNDPHMNRSEMPVSRSELRDVAGRHRQFAQHAESLLDEDTIDTAFADWDRL